MANRLKLNIPKLSEWAKAFRVSSNQSARATLANLNVAESALSKLNLPNKQNMTAVELYPGLGVWTAALVNSGFKRVIALENTPKYAKHMTALAETSGGVVDVLKKDGYDWETYIELKKPEYLGKLINTDWSKVHPKILFTGTLPKSVKGEQLLAQFASCITNRMAMHSNGRIMMAMWLPDQLYHKFTAPPGSHTRCKMSIVIEACANVELIATAEPENVYPNHLYHLVQVTPLEQKRLKSDWDVFEYVLKHLFVNQKKPLSKTISQLGPGANILIPRLSFDPSVLVVDMTVEQIDEVAIKFDQWPLRPRNLFDSEMVL